MEAYIHTFTDFPPAKEIASASHISNGRLAIHISSREAVIDAVQHGLRFDDTFLRLTPLVRPTTRLTLSNVYPKTNSVLIKNLTFPQSGVPGSIHATIFIFVTKC